MNPIIQPFHLAIPVHDLEESRLFYSDILGCPEGRSSEKWIDFNLFGHQLVTHLVNQPRIKKVNHNNVDGEAVPVPHFGVVLEWNQWQSFADMLKSKSVSFIIEPTIRFKGKKGEQATMFFYDPSDNALEFKAFKDPTEIFSK